jgi:plasmid stabilization system protein ParE
VRVRWLRTAVDEARDARLYYDARKTGLGARFVRELAATVTRVRELPLAWPEVDPPVRRALVNRFPYLLHYAVESDTILIVGVYHAKRRPISWRDRLT